MFSVNRKLKLPLTIIFSITLAALVLAGPVVAGTPIGGPFDISKTPTDFETDVTSAYNSVREEYLVVWFNDGQYDKIYAQRLSKTGNKIGAAFPISDDNNHARQAPAVAYNSQQDQYLVVWSDYDFSTTYSSIQARRVSGAGDVLDSFDFLISNYGAGYSASMPAVAYSSASDRYMVVWSELRTSPFSYGIYARMITNEGNYAGTIVQVSQSDYDHNEPDIAYNSSTDRHLVVWAQRSSAIGAYDIRGRQLHGSGGTYSTAFDIDSEVNNAVEPAVAAIGSAAGVAKFLVVYDYEYSLTDHDILGVFVSDNSGIVSHIAPGTSHNNEIYPDVAGSEGAGKFLLVWREDVGPFDVLLKFCQYDRTGAMLGPIYEINTRQSTLGSVSAGPLGDFLIAWQDVPGGQSDRDLFGVMFGIRSYAPLISK